MTLPISETPQQELARRAKRLLATDGRWVSEDQRELILEGWTKWPIIIVSNRVDDLNNTVYHYVYYDTPAPQMISSNDQDHEDLPRDLWHLDEVLDALRRMMLLDDLADV